VKPPRPELTKEEIEARDKQNAAYEAWVQAGRDKATKVKPWQDRFNFYMNNDWTAELMSARNRRSASTSRSNGRRTTRSRASWSSSRRRRISQNPIVERIVSNKPVSAMRPAFLKLGKTYHWRVSATDADGAKSVSDVRSFTTTDTPRA
jgi:hypothetical protein